MNTFYRVYLILAKSCLAFNFEVKIGLPSEDFDFFQIFITLSLTMLSKKLIIS